MKAYFMTFLFFLISMPLPLIATEDQFSCPSEITPQTVGEMILEADFSGMRFFHEGESECLNQANFPHIRVIPDPPQDAIDNYYYYELKERDGSFAKVTQFESLDEEMGLFRIYFEVDALSSRSGERSILTDSLTYIVYPSERVRKSNGCGGMIASPERFYLKPSCLPEDFVDPYSAKTE